MQFINPVQKYKEDNPLMTWEAIERETDIDRQTLWLYKKKDLEQLKQMKIFQALKLLRIGVNILEVIKNYEHEQRKEKREERREEDRAKLRETI
jgi:hypothetical protein